MTEARRGWQRLQLNGSLPISYSSVFRVWLRLKALASAATAVSVMAVRLKLDWEAEDLWA